jgi:hypothetical protein
MAEISVQAFLVLRAQRLNQFWGSFVLKLLLQSAWPCLLEKLIEEPLYLWRLLRLLWPRFNLFNTAKELLVCDYLSLPDWHLF